MSAIRPVLIKHNRHWNDLIDEVIKCWNICQKVFSPDKVKSYGLEIKASLKWFYTASIFFITCLIHLIQPLKKVILHQSTLITEYQYKDVLS